MRIYRNGSDDDYYVRTEALEIVSGRLQDSLRTSPEYQNR